MKNLFTIIGFLFLIFLTNVANAQAPEGFVYQAEIRNDKGRTLSNSNVSLDVRILTQINNPDDWVWQREYNVSTDKFGLVSVIVEDAVPASDRNKLFSDIDWGGYYHYLYVRVNDGSGWIPMGDPVLIMSVPYSLYSNVAGFSDTAEYARQGGTGINVENLKSGDIVMYTDTGLVAAPFEFYYRDADGDEYGVEDNFLYSPVTPPGYVANFGDCDDSNYDANPGAVEICDGLDNDCDGLTDETCDDDGDGYTADVDCDDSNYDANPGATEICDGVDNDCDGLVDENCNCINGDTQPCGSSEGACEQGFQTCIDGEWGACEGEVLPSQEVCNGIDDDCDGQVDEGLTDSDPFNCGACGQVCSYPHATAECIAGVCELGQCESGWADCDGDPSNGCETSLTTIENCGSCDNVCPPGWTCDGNQCQPPVDGTPCDDGDPCTVNDVYINGQCVGTPRDCSLPHAITTCDNGNCTFDGCETGWGDCDGEPSNGCEVDLMSDAIHCGACNISCPSGWTCIAGVCVAPDNDGDGYPADVDCDDTNPNINPRIAEICDGVDNNCNGLIDQLDVPVQNMCALPNNVLTLDCFGTLGCAIGQCDQGWADCDGNFSNGCEVNLNNNVSPSGAINLGDNCGDNGEIMILSTSGFGQQYYAVNLTECYSFIRDLTLRVNLNVPSSVDYNLIVYNSNGQILGLSNNYGGDSVFISINDTLAVDDNQMIYIKVEYAGGSTCDQWQIQIYGGGN